jgi:hypothetical protein
MKQEKNTGEHANAPEKKFSTGAICATIWKNQKKTPEGDKEYSSITIERRYKDKEGNWKSTSSLRITDLPKLVLVANKAYEFLVLKNGESFT